MVEDLYTVTWRLYGKGPMDIEPCQLGRDQYKDLRGNSRKDIEKNSLKN